MPFLGKYSSLVSPIVELEDWSIRQLQHNVLMFALLAKL